MGYMSALHRPSSGAITTLFSRGRTLEYRIAPLWNRWLPLITPSSETVRRCRSLPSPLPMASGETCNQFSYPSGSTRFESTCAMNLKRFQPQQEGFSPFTFPATVCAMTARRYSSSLPIAARSCRRLVDRRATGIQIRDDGSTDLGWRQYDICFLEIASVDVENLDVD